MDNKKNNEYKHDVVNPSHYKIEGAMECIDETERTNRKQKIMIFDKCKNCNLYIPYQKDVKSILSKKTKTKYIDKGYCLYFYKTVKSDAWCEKHERKSILKK